MEVFVDPLDVLNEIESAMGFKGLDVIDGAIVYIDDDENQIVTSTDPEEVELLRSLRTIQKYLKSKRMELMSNIPEVDLV
jgi:hypothetical protein